MFKNGFPKHWSTLKKLIWLVGSGVAGGASAVEKTVSGAIVHILDALAKPAISLVCQINPVQDLHGQDAPYPAGGGKNILPPQTSQTKNYVTITVADDGTITVNGTASENTYFDVDFTGVIPNNTTIYLYAFNPVASTGSNNMSIFVITDDGNPQVNLNSINATYTSYNSSSDRQISKWRLKVPQGVTYTNFIVKPMFQIGGTAPTAYSPYDNICPISGWTGVTVEHTGVNVWDEEWELGAISNSTGQETASNSSIRAKNYIPVIGGSNYYVKCPDAIYINFYNHSKAWVDYIGATKKDVVIPIPDNVAFIRISMRANYGTTYNHDISINYPSTDTAYHAYTGETIPISWQTEAGTVYGGNINLTTGVLKSSLVKHIFDGTETIAFSRTSATQGYAMFSLGAKDVYISASGISNMLKPVASGINTTDWAQMVQNSSAYNRDQIAFRFDSSFDGGNVQGCIDNYKAELARLYAANTPLEVVYEIATPQTYQLDPVTVNLLLGENNLWHDANGNTELTYYADGNASTSEALGILLGGAYHNPGGDDDATDDEALNILLGN